MRAKCMHARQERNKLWLLMKGWVPSSHWQPWRDTDCSHGTAFPVNLVDLRCSCFHKLKRRRSNLPNSHEKKLPPSPWGLCVCRETAVRQPYYQPEQCKLCIMHSYCVIHFLGFLGCQYATRLSQRTTAWSHQDIPGCRWTTVTVLQLLKIIERCWEIKSFCALCTRDCYNQPTSLHVQFTSVCPQLFTHILHVPLFQPDNAPGASQCI